MFFITHILQVLVVHYEHLKEDLVGQMQTLLKFLRLPFQETNNVQKGEESRIHCLLKHKDGFFKRDSNSRQPSEKQYDITPFPKHMRDQMDSVIDHINQHVLMKYGYPEMPLHLYSYYKQVKIISPQILYKLYNIKMILQLIIYF